MKTIDVTAAIVRKNGKILIARRAPHKPLGGFWEFPGGKIENGETPEECLKRELKEELDITVKVRSFLAENTHNYETFSVRLLAYETELLDGEISESTDHDEIAWVSKEEIKKYNMAPADIPILTSLSPK